MKKFLGRYRNERVDRVWNGGDLDLGEDTVPRTAEIHCLIRISENIIKYDN